MSAKFTEMLRAHDGNSVRRAASNTRLAAARSAGDRYAIFSDPGLTVFAAGSMGRAELGTRSDLDLFILAIKSFDDPEKEKLVAGLDEFIADLNYPPLTNREYVKVYELGNILRNTGSPKDDTENCFTTRMLLLLESIPVVNPDAYSQVLDHVLSQYFRDERGKSSYRPLFLLNDILRYWRTLCLNYEALRHDIERPWWKKNVNLKFSRMLTVFATVAALTVEEIHSKDDFVSVCGLTPIQRLARALDFLDDDEFAGRFQCFLNDYEAFLCWKERGDIDTMVADRDFKTQVRSTADRTSDFLYSVLTHTRIPQERRKFLVI